MASLVQRTLLVIPNSSIISSCPQSVRLGLVHPGQGGDFCRTGAHVGVGLEDFRTAMETVVMRRWMICQCNEAITWRWCAVK
jgi:hypothetical protein